MNKFKLFLFFTFLIVPLYGFENHKIDGYMMFQDILTGNENGLEATSGSLIGLKLEYSGEIDKDLKGFINFYSYEPVEFLMDREKRLPKSYFANREAGGESTLGEIYLIYQRGNYSFSTGRKSIKYGSEKYRDINNYSFVPNIFELYGLKYKGVNGVFNMNHLTKISLGTSSMPNYGLIGEHTASAGTVVHITKKNEYLNIGEIAGLDKKTSGITMLAYSTDIDRVNLELINYYAYGISNILYIESSLKYKFGSLKMRYSFQLLNQIGVGDTNPIDNLSATMLGAKIKVKYKKLTSSIALNRSYGDTFFNFFGLDPAFTSSIFSKNSYRKDVTAYKVMLLYNLNKNWKTLITHSNYGQSKTVNIKGWSPIDDATETDIALIYKPTKNFTIKLLKILRVSEYNGVIVKGDKNDRTMDTFRLGVGYKF